MLEIRCEWPALAGAGAAGAPGQPGRPGRAVRRGGRVEPGQLISSNEFKQDVDTARAAGGSLITETSHVPLCTPLCIFKTNYIVSYI